MSVVPTGQTSYEFEYGLIGRHQGIFLCSIGLVVVGSILGYSVFSSRPPEADEVGIFVGFLFVFLLMGVAAERIHRRRFGRIRLTDTEISLHCLDGSIVTLRWDEIRSVVEFTRWSPWGEMGGHPGVRLASEQQEILIYSNIRRWKELRSILQAKSPAIQPR